MAGSGGSDPDDPFGWSNERLIKELCTDDRTWKAPVPRKWPDPVHLASMLEEHDLDGQDLLTHEDQMGREGFETLCKDLEIKKIPHKTSLRMAIRTLQERSLAYKAWKEGVDPGSADAFPSQQSHRDIFDTMHIDDVDNSPWPTNSPAAAHKKRKRLAPTNVSFSARPRSSHFFNGIDDETTAVAYNPLLDTMSDRTWQKSNKGAYLGHWKLTVDDILQAPDPLRANAHDDDISGHSRVKAFGWAIGAAIPAGRRFQVHRILSRFLRPKRAQLPQLGRYRPEDTPRSSGAIGARHGIIAGDEDLDDEVLPALGESDDEEYDTETWEAMEEEALERQNQQSQLQNQSQKYLSREAVDRAIADAIRAMEATWTDKKAHKLQRQAHRLWQDARRTGSQKFMADTARREVERFAQRVNKLVEEIRLIQWKTEAEIARQAVVLEASVEDRQLALWEAKLYSLPSAPPKVTSERAARPETRTIRTKIVDGDDDEILTSSSSEDDRDDRSLGSFIVDDDRTTDGTATNAMDLDNNGDGGDDDDDDDDIMDDGLASMVRPNPIPLPPADQDKNTKYARSPTWSLASSPRLSPARSPAQSPSRSPARSFARSPRLSPARSPRMPPARSPRLSPARSPRMPFVRSPTWSLASSPRPSPARSPRLPPARSPARSPRPSPARSPRMPAARSPRMPPARSPARSPRLSPARSPRLPPARSPARSPRPSPARSPRMPAARSPRMPPARSPARSPRLSPARSPRLSPVRSPTWSPRLSPARSPEHESDRAPSLTELPSVLHDEDIWAITSTGPAHYENTKDVTRLLLVLFYDACQEQMSRLFGSLDLDDEAIWQKYCLSTLAPGPKDETDQDQLMVDANEPVPEEKPEDDGTLFTRFFYIFLFCHNVSPNDFDPTSENTKKELLDNRGRLGSFCGKMRMLAPYFGYGSFRSSQNKDKAETKGKKAAARRNSTRAASPVIESAQDTPTSSPEQSMLSPAAEAGPSDAGYVLVESDINPTSLGESHDKEDESLDKEDDSRAKEDESLDKEDESLDKEDDTEEDDSRAKEGDPREEEDDSHGKEGDSREEKDKQVVASKRRKRTVRRDKGAQDLRDKDKARHENLETRRKALYESLETSGTMSRDRARLIINLAKEDHHGFIYINHWISFNIRDHQIEGVRFMWNQIITPSDSRQGCLLAHTMGLGKTMQVITLLVAVAEAAKSPDNSIASQIPEDLRQSKTLILCPSGLVDNWMDELMAWAQDGVLGETSQVTSAMGSVTRRNRIETWARDGGIMVLGYPMFSKLLEEFDDFATLLQETPNIVVADEAHALKNPKSKVHRNTSNFRTSARIAMTGSPLANSVEEYHSMINWVAPNYLADHREFVSVYANPIKEGFYRDSLPSQKRHAYKMLKILKDTVAPKIHRATVASLKGELPEKREFILFLPLTDIQLSVYREFMHVVRHYSELDGITNTLQLWNFMFNVTLLLAHPVVLRTRLEEMQESFSSPDDGHKRKATLSPVVVAKLLDALQHAAEQAGGSNGSSNGNVNGSGTADASASPSPSLNQMAYSSKMTVLCGILDEARRVNDKVLVFSQSCNVLDYLESELRRLGRKFVRLDGGTAVGTRQAMVKDFNAGDDEVYLISTTAGGVGLNIHGANRVVIFDFRWNPMHEQQAIGRAFRIGQRKNVFVYWLIVDGTYETLLHDQAVFKTQLASRVVDKKNPSAWADQMRNYTKDPVKVPVDSHVAADFRGRDAVLDALLTDGAASRSQIARIVTTDTFEQEEPEAMLTAQELSEAATMVTMNKRRLKNGGHTGTMAVVAAEATAFPAERMQVDGANFAFAPSAAAHAVPAPMPMALATAPSAPSAPRVLQPPVPMPTPAQPIANAAPAVPMQISTQAMANAAPAMRADSRNGAAPTPSQPAAQHARLPLHAPATLPSAFSTPTPTLTSTSTSTPMPTLDAIATPSAGVSRLGGLMASDSDLRDEITRSLARGAVTTQAKPSMHIAACIADAVVGSIKENFALSGLPASSQWARLKQGVTSDAVVLEAVAYGIADPAVLAMMNHKLETRYVTGLHAAIESIGTDADPAQLPWHMRELFCNNEALRRVLMIKMLEGALPSLPAYKGDYLRAHAKALAVVDCIKRLHHPSRPGAEAEATKDLLARYNRIAFRDGTCADYLVSATTRLSQRMRSGLSKKEAADMAEDLANTLRYAIRQRGGTRSLASTPSTQAPASAPASATADDESHRRARALKSERRNSHGTSLLDIPLAASNIAVDPPMLSAISNGFQRARDDFQQSQPQSLPQSQPAPSSSGTPVSREQLSMKEVMKRMQRQEEEFPQLQSMSQPQPQPHLQPQSHSMSPPMSQPQWASTPAPREQLSMKEKMRRLQRKEGRRSGSDAGQGSPRQVQHALHRTKSQLARETQGADERQWQYRLQQSKPPSKQLQNKARIQAPSSQGPTSSRGPGTANDPVVLEDD